MSLGVIKSAPKRRTFLTYDLEWVPGTLEVRLVGVFDGKRYRCYRNVDTFLNKELTSKNRGKWFYAHAGGLADFQFILERLEQRDDYQVKSCFSGSSAIISTVTRGKNAWHFVDSYWLLQGKLEAIGKWIGIEKGEEEARQTEEEAREYYATAPLHRLIPYNEIDCVILWKAIYAMQNILLELGGQLQKTLASSAMYLFRKRFLSDDIPTNWAVNSKSQKAYSASRVEVLSTRCSDAEYYDINSSFPYAMTKPCPGEFLGTSKRIPDHGIYIADVMIRINECYFPPTPMRMKDRLFFPIGTWRGWLSSVDIELIQQEGHKILKVYEVMKFAPFEDLSAYAHTLYNMRKQAETPFERQAFKLLLNSLYGKFAEGEEKQALHINPEKIDRENWVMLFPGAWIFEKRAHIPHRHVPVSVHITSQARRTLFEHMIKSVRDSKALHYCDTDGFSTTRKYDTSSDLGGLKLEKKIREGYFRAPKFYRLEGVELQKDGTWKELGDKGIKAKGFSRMNAAKWEALNENKAIRYERMRRIKEQARRGTLSPVEVTIEKRLQNVVLAKRFHYTDGTSRPWTAIELRKYFKGNRRH